MGQGNKNPNQSKFAIVNGTREREKKKTKTKGTNEISELGNFKCFFFHYQTF